MSIFDQIKEFFSPSINPERDEKLELEHDLFELPDDASGFLVSAIEAELAVLHKEGES